MTQTPDVIRCSVKKFVNFACRTGDLDGTSTAGPTAAEGQRAHKKLQKKKLKDEQSEVAVKTTLDINGRQLCLSGRVDLCNPTPQAPTITEIKSCYVPSYRLPESAVSLHWAQLKVYGYCTLTKLQEDHSQAATEITLKLVWYNLLANEVTEDTQKFSYDELTTFTTGAAIRYVSWISIVEEQFADTVSTATKLEFPHNEFRAGQRDMAASVYCSARDRFALMCEAPTGIGKTVSSLFPAIKAIGTGHIERVIYLTAKNSGRRAAADCLEQITGAGAKLSAITITAKKTSCHCSNGTCERRPDDGRCPLTIGFFDRLPAARASLIKDGVISPEQIDNAAYEHALCPFELTQQLLPWVQVIVCDYNYVFDPLVQFAELIEHPKQTLLLVDEAHNLPDRARSMYSAEIDKQKLKQSISALDKTNLLTKRLHSIVRALDAHARDSLTKEGAQREHVSDEPPKSLSRAVNNCIAAMNDDTDNQLFTSDSIVETMKALMRYSAIESLYADSHRTITTRTARGKYKNTTVQLQCLNATAFLRKRFAQFGARVCFSATMSPTEFMTQSLGLNDDTACLSLDSPFDPANQSTLVCSWVDTRYNARANSINPIVDIIGRVISARRGNYQVFFPSYAFMQAVHDDFVLKHPDENVILQERGSSESDRNNFLHAFKSDKPVLAFSIIGGIYGEGVDYTGEQLVGAIVIGTGLPSMSVTQKLIEQDFHTRGLNGFDYASRYPGFTRVLQTAGRVIRSQSDIGTVVLVEQRLQQAFYRNLFPKHWQPEFCNNSAQLSGCLESFWLRHTKRENSAACEKNQNLLTAVTD